MKINPVNKLGKNAGKRKDIDRCVTMKMKQTGKRIRKSMGVTPCSFHMLLKMPVIYLLRFER